jgi:hypothetical protein
VLASTWSPARTFDSRLPSAAQTSPVSPVAPLDQFPVSGLGPDSYRMSDDEPDSPEKSDADQSPAVRSMPSMALAERVVVVVGRDVEGGEVVIVVVGIVVVLDWAVDDDVGAGEPAREVAVEKSPSGDVPVGEGFGPLDKVVTVTEVEGVSAVGAATANPGVSADLSPCSMITPVVAPTAKMITTAAARMIARRIGLGDCLRGGVLGCEEFPIFVSSWEDGSAEVGLKRTAPQCAQNSASGRAFCPHWVQ